MYDSQCYDLAKLFLDEAARAYGETPLTNEIVALAQEIQDVIEDDCRLLEERLAKKHYGEVKL